MRDTAKGRLLGGLLAAGLLLAGCGGPAKVVAPPDQPSAGVEAAQTVDALAIADGPGDSPLPAALVLSFRKVFAEHDLNRDGAIQPGEVPWAVTSFRQLDADGNGALSVAETQPNGERLNQMAILARRATKELFSWVDSNQDKYVTLAELNAEPAFGYLRKEPEWIRVANRVQSIGRPLAFEHFEALVAELLADPDKFFKGVPPRAAQSGPPVLLVAGHMQPSWHHLVSLHVYLKHKGMNVRGVNPFPNFGDIREQAGQVAREIEKFSKETGAKVKVLAHSTGGLTARWAIEKTEAHAHVAGFVGLGVPHYGTYANLAGLGEAGDQVAYNGKFVNELNGGSVHDIPTASIYTVSDEVVVPATSARLDGSQLYPAVLGTGHLTLTYAPHGLAYTLDALTK